jgi:hypothetical protein
MVRAAVAVVTMVAVTGCIKLDMDLSVEGDTVDGTIVMAIDRQTAQLFEMEPEEFFDDPGEDDFRVLDGVTVEPYEDDDWLGIVYLFHRVDLDDLNDLAGDDDELPRIVHDAASGTYEFRMTFDMTDMAGLDDVDEFGEEAGDDPGFPGLDPSALLDTFEVRVAVTFPGEVTDHNGELSGTTVTWQPEPGELVEMRATAHVAPAAADDPAAGPAGGGVPEPAGSAGSSPSTLVSLLVALGVLVLVGTGLLVLWLTRRSSAAPAPSTVEPTTVEPTTGAPTAAPPTVPQSPPPEQDNR